MAAVRAEAGHNRRHFKAATLELSEVKKELQAKEHLVQTLQAEADELQWVPDACTQGHPRAGRGDLSVHFP